MRSHWSAPCSEATVHPTEIVKWMAGTTPLQAKQLKMVARYDLPTNSHDYNQFKPIFVVVTGKLNKRWRCDRWLISPSGVEQQVTKC